MSTTAQKGFEEFISRIRRASNDYDLHPLKMRTDNGSEFVGGAWKAWLNSRRVDHPGFYARTYYYDNGGSVCWEPICRAGDSELAQGAVCNLPGC